MSIGKYDLCRSFSLFAKIRMLEHPRLKVSKVDPTFSVAPCTAILEYARPCIYGPRWRRDIHRVPKGFLPYSRRWRYDRGARVTHAIKNRSMGNEH